ncbi:MAG: YfiR family protein [Chitinophagaceae bacterium]|nr:YfiR family protein [Chitinophagaceae bacterium]
MQLLNHHPTHLAQFGEKSQDGPLIPKDTGEGFIPIFYTVSRKLLIKIGFVMIILLQSLTRAEAQSESDYAVQANIVYHFTKYIDWPADRKSGDFIIGVAGDSPMYDQLKKNVFNKVVGNQRIVIKRFSTTAQIFSCHILFVPDDESDNIKYILARIAIGSTLLVTESEGLAKKGACINFSIVSDRLKLEINKKNILLRELSIASELLNLGKIIN